MLISLGDGIGSIEVIVVDDKSVECEFVKIKEICIDHGVTLLQVDDSPGFGSHTCRNIGVQYASCEDVCLVDTDAVFTKTLIDRMLAFSNFKNIIHMFHTIAVFDYHDTKKGLWDFAGKQRDIYNFYHDYMHYNKTHNNHINFFLMKKQSFIDAGGYDSELFNIRDGDRMLMWKLLNNFGMRRYTFRDKLYCNILTKKFKKQSKNHYTITEKTYKKSYDLIKIYHQIMNKKSHKFIAQDYHICYQPKKLSLEIN